MMSLRSGCARWLLIVVIAVCLSSVAAAAACPTHGHQTLASDSCSLCQFGHLPFTLAPDVPQFEEPLQVTCAIAPRPAPAPASLDGDIPAGRAPPAA